MTVTCSREVMAQTHFKYGPFKNNKIQKKVRMRNVKNDAEKQHVKNILMMMKLDCFFSVEEYTWDVFFITMDLYMNVNVYV